MRVPARRAPVVVRAADAEIAEAAIKLGQTKIKIRAKASELAALQFSGRTVAWVRLRLLKLATVNDVHRKNPPFTTAESGKSVPFPVLYDPNC